MLVIPICFNTLIFRPQVIEEKLTYINTHANLSVGMSFKVIEEVVNTRGTDIQLNGLNHIISTARKQYITGLNSRPNSEAYDVRLDSFVAYLMKNAVPEVLVTLALLEQFSQPGLDNEGLEATRIRRAAEEGLTHERERQPAATKELMLWHQSYHLFRVTANCFVLGVEEFAKAGYERALDYFTVAYKISARIIEEPPKVNKVNKL